MLCHVRGEGSFPLLMPLLVCYARTSRMYPKPYCGTMCEHTGTVHMSTVQHCSLEWYSTVGDVPHPGHSWNEMKTYGISYSTPWNLTMSRQRFLDDLCSEWLHKFVNCCSTAMHCQYCELQPKYCQAETDEVSLRYVCSSFKNYKLEDIQHVLLIPIPLRAWA